MPVSIKWLSDDFCGLSCESNENHNSGSSGGNTLWVQVPSSAPKEELRRCRCSSFFVNGTWTKPDDGVKKTILWIVFSRRGLRVLTRQRFFPFLWHEIKNCRVSSKALRFCEAKAYQVPSSAPNATVKPFLTVAFFIAPDLMRWIFYWTKGDKSNA